MVAMVIFQINCRELGEFRNLETRNGPVKIMTQRKASNKKSIKYLSTLGDLS